MPHSRSLKPNSPVSCGVNRIMVVLLSDNSLRTPSRRRQQDAAAAGGFAGVDAPLDRHALRDR